MLFGYLDSSIEDERLKKLFVGMDRPKNRTINLSDKQDQLNELVRIKPTSLSSKIQRKIRIYFLETSNTDDLYASESVAKSSIHVKYLFNNLLEEKQSSVQMNLNSMEKYQS